ncbi:hypothetical protein A3Q56_06162 [Intoshia linei]|uniref:6-phosphofructokinase n=1 Tax=Intoshia linei TaxID=1819745 RepID=A0A177AY57_9BILA|nr:hypothetical protein A3Q56_06162 [Intoshia linei]
MGQRLNIIIVAEGAIDENGHKISSNRLQHLVEDRLQYDTRITILGHVQRGGNPSAFDRILATRMGVEAVVAILDTTTNSEPSVISINGNKICRIPLKKSVELTSSIKDAYAKKDYECVMHLRGPNYVKNLNNYLMMSKLYMKCPSIHLDALHPKIYIVNVGAPACGINACVRSLTKLFILNKCIVYHVKNGLNGFIDNEIYTANWSNTNYWIHEGGSLLGTNRNTPKKIGIDVLAEKFKMRNINCLIIIGGYEAFLSVVQMEEARKDHSEFRIPIGIIPATISNNVPGTTLCIGSDTALNEITYTCDRLKQSATGTRKRVFIVETHGGFCGYLATMAGLSSGADAAYIFEKKIDVQDIKNDAEHLVQKMSEGTERGIILRCEKASKNYDIHFMRAIFEEIGQDSFDTRINVIGHIQQVLILHFAIGRSREALLYKYINRSGSLNTPAKIKITGRPSKLTCKERRRIIRKASKFVLSARDIRDELDLNSSGGSPSAFDRALASKFATFTVNFVMNLFKEKEIASNCDINSYEDSESAFIIGIESCTKATPVKIVYQNADNVHRIPKNQWWMCTQNLLRILAKHELC